MIGHVLIARFLLLVALAWSSFAIAMQELEDQFLGEVVAQDGISLELQLRINTLADGNADPTLTNCDGAGSAATSECRLAVSFENRAGEWLLFRGAFAFIDIFDIRLDAAQLGQAGSKASLFDASRFFSPTGACLLEGGVCTSATLNALPALRVSYPATTVSYNSVTRQSSGFTSMGLGLRIRETVVAFGANAFSSTTAGSFLGVNVRDNNSNRAGIAITGNAFVFGF